MNTRKVINKEGAACGCEITTDHRGNEQLSILCIPHKKEFDMRHAAAVESCSHVNRDLVSPTR
jgi:hypothetical protein